MSKESSNEEGVVGLGFLFVVLIFSLFFGLFGGNYWCTRDGVLGRIQEKDPNVVSVLYINRRIFNDSEAVARRLDGTTVKYLVDADIFFNCTVKESDD